MFILEGNIGAGKSTFLRLLKEQFPEFSVTQEQVNDWQQHVYGQSLLANFYQEPKRWAYTFEALTAVCRVQEHVAEQKKAQLCLMERSIYSGYFCFAFNSYQQGFLTKLEWEVYQEWFTFLVRNTCKVPQGFIYLRVSPDVAYERLRKRKRFAEKTVSLAYLKQIHARHEAMLVEKKSTLLELESVPVLIIDGNEEFEQNPEQFFEHIHSLKNFFKKTDGENRGYLKDGLFAYPSR